MSVLAVTTVQISARTFSRSGCRTLARTCIYVSSPANTHLPGPQERPPTLFVSRAASPQRDITSNQNVPRVRRAVDTSRTAQVEVRGRASRKHDAINKHGVVARQRTQGRRRVEEETNAPKMRVFATCAAPTPHASRPRAGSRAC